MWSVPLHVPCPCHGAWPRSGRGLYAPWEVACSPPVYAPLAAGTLLGRGSDSAGGAHAVYRVMGTYVCTNVQFFHANLEIITKLEAWILKLLETAGLLHACTVVGKIVTKSKATCTCTCTCIMQTCMLLEGVQLQQLRRTVQVRSWSQ